MKSITKGVDNTLYLNTNNNNRTSFTGYTLTFVHSMSQYTKSYDIDLSDPTQFTSNERYCTVKVPLGSDDLYYYGQYSLKIYGNGSTLLQVSLLKVVGEDDPFIENESNNDNNENYIYIQ